MSVALQPILVQTGGPDEDGQLAFVDGRLAAVLVRLSGQHGASEGQWFLEAGFGPFDGPNHPLFADLDAATAWFLDQEPVKPVGLPPEGSAVSREA